ncbi:preprotein translocase subunit SecE [Desulforamulus aquiferis]|uniref:Protein translocase subunit SecE n=1 Tax=Desulforamulus aquiferis TaxID=1397668 RepID=A0AAW7ZK55_9FIRM|nr:preprotein translocase subunit SecE [Desulforamulus aquiferis]MDO7789164.1 preprotein translocase subunit SecE [Desulforamulus aquiferis]
MAVQKKQVKRDSAAKEIAATKETSGAENKKEVAPKEAAKPLAKSQVKVQRATFSERTGGIKKYLRGVQNELKKVHWPTRKEVITYTAVVFAAVTAVAAVIWVLDSILSLGVGAIMS